MIWTILACSSQPTAPTEAPRPKLAVTPPRAEVIPASPAPTEPAVAPREGLTVAQQAGAWDQDPGPCEGCQVLKARAQASSERLDGEVLQAAASAQDGDPTTGWCGMEGIGDQLVFATGEPVDLQRIHFAGWTGDGPAITEVLVTSDRGDRFLLTLPPPSATQWPDGGAAPVLEVELTGVQHLQFEVRATNGRGPACVAEVALEGTRG